MMRNSELNGESLSTEITFTASKSGGPGGQHVNKVNTKVTLKFDILQSELLTERQKEQIKEKLSTKISNQGVLVLSSSNKRSQLMNKQSVIKKFNVLLRKVFEVKKKRKPTKPGKAAIEKRLKSKKLHSNKKKTRQERF